ncbi:unnamed protein product, partial [Symbiodinium sp. KB8]
MDYQLESPNDSPIAQNDSKASDSSQDEGIDASNSDGDEVGEGKIRKTLSWGVVEVTEFSRTVGLASSVPADGAWPLGMDPEPISTEQIVIPLDEVEKAKGNEAKGRPKALKEKARMELLSKASSLTDEELAALNKAVEDELEEIRESRGASGCSCEGTIPDIKKWSTAKVIEDLERLGYSTEGSRPELMTRLREAHRDVPVCGSNCECVKAGIGCHSLICACDCSRPITKKQKRKKEKGKLAHLEEAQRARADSYDSGAEDSDPESGLEAVGCGNIYGGYVYSKNTVITH